MKLNDKNMSILIGLLLGDGYIDDKGRIGIEHCEKQKDYCIYKAKLLHSVCGGKDIIVHNYTRNNIQKKDDKVIKNRIFVTYSFKKQSKHFIPIRHLLYKEDRRKHISQEVLNYLTSEAIALWWLDDGNISKKYTYRNDKRILCGYNLHIYTYISYEENLLIQKYFLDKYNIKWNIDPVPEDKDKEIKRYYLRCGTVEGRKFLSIIREYVKTKIPSMDYKVIDI